MTDVPPPPPPPPQIPGRVAPGIPVDQFGGPTIDPTKNVLDLVNAAVKRIDDIALIKEQASTDRFIQEQRYVRELMGMMREYDDKLRLAESKRIDAIRLVDVQAVQTASEKASQAAQVLQAQVVSSSDQFRALVSSVAENTASQLRQMIGPMSDRLALIEKNQYQGAGKESVTDPMIAALLTKIDSLAQSRSEDVGKGLGRGELIAYVIAAIAIIGFVLSTIGFLLHGNQSP